MAFESPLKIKEVFLKGHLSKVLEMWKFNLEMARNPRKSVFMALGYKRMDGFSVRQRL